MPDVTLFDIDVHDSFTFDPTTLVGSDAFDSADAAGAAGTADDSAEPESNGGIGRVLLTAVALAVVSTVVAVAVARLLSDDDLSDLTGLDETETRTDDGARVPPSRS